MTTILRWEVVQEVAGRPELVRFAKWGVQRKLLDSVERHMRRTQP